MGYSKIPIQGYVSVADLSATPTEESARIPMWYVDQNGDRQSVVLSATDYIELDQCTFNAPVTGIVYIYGGSDVTVDVGDRLYLFRIASGVGVVIPKSKTLRRCALGTYPKVWMSAGSSSSGTSEISIHGFWNKQG